MHLIGQTKKYVIIKLDMCAICSYVPTPYIPICKFLVHNYKISHFFLSCKRDLFDIIGLVFFLTGFFCCCIPHKHAFEIQKA